MHEGANFSRTFFEEYTSHVPTIESFLAYSTAEPLDKWNREYNSAKNDHNLVIL